MKRLLLIAAALAAAAPSSPAAAQHADFIGGSPMIIEPGDSLLDAGRIRPGTYQYARVSGEGRDEVTTGTYTDRITVSGGRLTRVLRMGPQNSDSMVSSLPHLAAQSHHGYSPEQGDKLLKFDGRQVTGILRYPNGQRVPVAVTAQPAFHEWNWDLVLRALPLALGMQVRYPVYIVGADVTVGWFQATVFAREPWREDPSVIAWEVHVDIGSGSIRAWIAEDDRRLLRHEIRAGGYRVVTVLRPAGR